MMEESPAMSDDLTGSGSMDTMMEGDKGSDTMMENSVKEFTVDAQNYSFSPATMTVKKGDNVKITLVNKGGTHDLVVDEFGVSTPRTTTGQTATIEFVADKVGSFEYYCSVGNHRAMGMWGTLKVTE